LTVALPDAFSWISDYVGCADAALPQADFQSQVCAAVRARVPLAQAIIVYGSALHGHVGRFSDVDAFCVIVGPDTLEKHQFIASGMMFDVGVLSLSLLPKIQELSRRFGRPVGLFALAHGELWSGDIPNFRTVQAAAQKLVATHKSVRPDAVDVARRGVLRDLMAIAKSGREQARTIHAIALVNRLARIYVETYLGTSQPSHSAVDGFVSADHVEILRLLMRAILAGQWDEFSNLVRASFFDTPITWERTSKLI
jgi:hypothetical protein